MSYTAEFAPGQAILSDRSRAIDAPATSPFASVRAPQHVDALVVYVPAITLPGKTRRTRIGNRIVEFAGLPLDYAHLYLTSVRPLEFDGSTLSATRLTMFYDGEFRLAYRPHAPLIAAGAGSAPPLHVVQFTAALMIELNRGSDRAEDILIPLPTGLFPGSVTDNVASVFACHAPWPAGVNDTVNVVLTRGAILYL